MPGLYHTSLCKCLAFRQPSWTNWLWVLSSVCMLHLLYICDLLNTRYVLQITLMVHLKTGFSWNLWQSQGDEFLSTQRWTWPSQLRWFSWHSCVDFCLPHGGKLNLILALDWVLLLRSREWNWGFSPWKTEVADLTEIQLSQAKLVVYILN